MLHLKTYIWIGLNVIKIIKLFQNIEMLMVLIGDIKLKCLISKKFMIFDEIHKDVFYLFQLRLEQNLKVCQYLILTARDSRLTGSIADIDGGEFQSEIFGSCFQYRKYISTHMYFSVQVWTRWRENVLVGCLSIFGDCCTIKLRLTEKKE